MKRFGTIIAIVLLAVSIVLLLTNLFSTQPIQVVLETGQQVTTTNSDFFTLTKVLILVITSFFIGATTTYLYYDGDKSIVQKKSNDPHKGYDSILSLLKSDEKKVVSMLISNKGEILQNKLVLELGISKVKVTRILSRLERKELIIRKRQGMTNKVILAKRHDS